MGAEPVRPGLTIADLERWVETGAGWRAVEIDETYAVVELRTCVGEPVDVLIGEGTDLVAYVREQRSGPA